jgi:hypothetical protein
MVKAISTVDSTDQISAWRAVYFQGMMMPRQTALAMAMLIR